MTRGGEPAKLETQRSKDTELANISKRTSIARYARIPVDPKIMAPSVTRLLLARAVLLLTRDARVTMTFTKQPHALKHFAFIYVAW